MRNNYKNIIIALESFLVYHLGENLPLRWMWIVIAVFFFISFISNYLFMRAVQVRRIDTSNMDGIPQNIQDLISKIEQEWNCGDPNCNACQSKLKDKQEKNHEN